MDTNNLPAVQIQLVKSKCDQWRREGKFLGGTIPTLSQLSTLLAWFVPTNGQKSQLIDVFSAIVPTNEHFLPAVGGTWSPQPPPPENRPWVRPSVSERELMRWWREGYRIYCHYSCVVLARLFLPKALSHADSSLSETLNWHHFDQWMINHSEMPEVWLCQLKLGGNCLWKGVLRRLSQCGRKIEKDTYHAVCLNT